jgi:hypothetical protein
MVAVGIGEAELRSEVMRARARPGRWVESYKCAGARERGQDKVKGEILYVCGCSGTCSVFNRAVLFTSVALTGFGQSLTTSIRPQALSYS